MSRANISFMDPKDHSVTFTLRNGTVRTYFYEAADFIAITGGADPAAFSGSQTPPNEMSSEIGANIGEAILDVSECL